MANTFPSDVSWAPAIKPRALDAEYKTLAIDYHHVEILTRATNISWYGGMYRLFTLCDDYYNLTEWNRVDKWKFAWGGVADRYLCFGENVWGDQLAYDFNDLKAGVSRVQLLSCTDFDLIYDWGTFAVFFDEFVCTDRCIDSMTRVLRTRHHEIAATKNAVYHPPLLIAGVESLDNVSLIDATTAMIICGDVYRQYSEAQDDDIISGIEPYTDEHDRPRVRLRIEGNA